MSDAINRWKHCVVNIEFGQHNDGSQARQSGTAIFIHYEGRYFLVTAAHLLIDRRIGSDKPLYSQIYKLLYRVPLLSELKDVQKKKILTRNLFFDESNRLHQQVSFEGNSYGHEGEDISSGKYILLSESINQDESAVTIQKDYDLAVISLRARQNEIPARLFLRDPLFFEELQLLDYQPATIEEIGEGPSGEGADILTVGYPNHISLVDIQDRILEKYEEYFSADVTLPCFTFGKISMMSSYLPFFWGDLRVYIGNSGCPVIEGDKIVGVVTHDAVMDEGNCINNVPFAKATKAKFIREMLDEQIKKG
ncbi:MAG: hypothetical protein PHT99_05040 [Methanoregula sp.]|nr:hypothetical protein [Methanoregula sp.]